MGSSGRHKEELSGSSKEDFTRGKCAYVRGAWRKRDDKREIRKE